MEEEIRKKAILRYIVDKEEPKTIYTSLDRTKPWFFKWLKRYLTGDTYWYRNRSRAPLKKPAEISKDNRDLIIAIRMRLESEPYAQIGASAIKWELRKLGVTFPSDSTLHRILKREGLVKKKCLCSQRGRVSVFYRGAGSEQYPSGRPGGSPVYKRRRQVLFVQRDGYLQPSGVCGVSKNQRG